MKPTTLLWCAAIAAACANVASPTPAAIDRLSQARQLLREDPHTALNITDDLLKARPKWREALLVAAEGCRRLADSSSGSQSHLLLADAAKNLEAVVADAAKGAEPEAWQMLAECRQALGEFPAAATAAMQAAEGFAALRTGDGRRRAAAAILLAGTNEQHAFAAARQREIDTGQKDSRGIVRPGKEVTAMAANLVAKFESIRREFPGEACARIATVYQYLGQDGAATAEFERGIRSSPEQAEIHTAFIDWMTAIGQQEALVGHYTNFVKENPTLPLLRWFHGRSHYARADQLRSIGNFLGGIASYEKSKAVYAEYAALDPKFADDARQWVALCELSSARCAVDMGDFAAAQRHLFAADEASPLAVAYDNGKPRLADTFGSHYTGVVFHMNRGLAESGANGVQKALDFNEAVIQRHPGRWGFVYNNAALPARDLGVQLANQGQKAGAMELWERSYRYYEKAVELSPDDARIVNDCGLMLVYHLHRDLDRARTLFDRAIEIGRPQLAAMPQNADRRERELLEEAIGDALQNIAVLMRNHLHRPFAEYSEFCRQSVQYYPYERRSAAALLRSEGADDGESTANTAARQGGAAEALAKVAPAVQTKADAGDFDAALALLDGIAKDCKNHAPFHARVGELTRQLAIQSRDANRKGTEFFFQDAAAALKRAVALDGEPTAPRLLLAQTLFDSNNLAEASTTASALLLHMQSKGGGRAEELTAVHTVRANAAARAYAALKGEKKEDAELLTAARTSMRALEQQDKLDAGLLDLWSITEQWAGAAAEAVNVFLRASRRNPADQALLGKLVDTAAAQEQLPLAIEALGKTRSDATTLWYLGKARYLQAGIERNGGKNAEAQKTLDVARQDFADSMKQNASYRDSCEQWSAMCLGKKGNIAYRSDDFANAEKWVLDAVRLRPDRITEDLGLGETTKQGVLLVAEKHRTSGDLAKVEAIFRAASDAAHGDVDLLNNSGLFARDYGVRLEREGKNKEAMSMYEQSYKAYSRAKQLDAASVRLRNDCALIAIHHLERDWDLARQLLDSAITDGKKTLRDNPPSERQEQQDLAEAVGDSFENLALWHLKHSKDYAAAKAAAQQSLEFHPGNRRVGANQHLQEAERLLQGK